MRFRSILFLCVCVGSLQAADKSWTGGVSANWGDAATWTPAGVPGSGESVSVSNSASGVTLTVQSGVAAVAASFAFQNTINTNATLFIANGGSLTVGGVVTKPGAGNLTVSVNNNTPTNAANVLTATNLTATTLVLSSTSADQTLTTGFDITLLTQLQLGSGAVNQNLTYRQTNGTLAVLNSDYGVCLLEGYARPTAGTQTFILDGGTLKADRIGVGNGNGNNGGSIDRYAGNGVLEFNDGTIASRYDGGNVWIENGSALETYNGGSIKIRDTQKNTSKPVTVRLSQSGTHTFSATANSAVVFSPSARLADKAGEAGTLTKAGAGKLILTGGGLAATNDWTGDTTVSQGTVKVDYSLLAGTAGSLALSSAYSPRSKLILSGGGFELAGRNNATNSTFSGVTVTSGGGYAESYNITVPATAGLVVGQTVTNAFLPAGTYIRSIRSGTSIGLSHMSTSTVAQAGQTLAFGAASFTSEQTVSNVELVASASTVTVTPGGTSTLLTFGTVTGAGGLVKAGAGTLRLTGAAAYAGTNTISAGTLEFACGGYTLLTNMITGAGTFRQSGAGTAAVIAVSGVTNTFSGAVVVDGGTLLQGTGTTYQRRGLSSAASYTVNSGGTLITSRDAMNDGASHYLNGGTLKQSGGFQCLGPVTLNGGTLMTGPGSGGPWQAFALSGNVAVTGAAPSLIRAGAGANNGLHLVFNAAAGALRTLRVEDVTGNAAADLTVSASLINSSHTEAAAGLIKTGAGTLLLAGGTNTYSGATVVSNGTLLVSGGMSNSAVTVVSGAAFGTADTQLSRVASLTLAENAQLVWKYDGDTHTAGRIAVTGLLTLPATASLDVSGAGFLYSGQALFSAGALAGATDLSGWTLTGAPAGSSVALAGNEVVLHVNRGTVMRVL